VPIISSHEDEIDLVTMLTAAKSYCRGFTSTIKMDFTLLAPLVEPFFKSIAELFLKKR
jgi:hypothetical protein